MGKLLYHFTSAAALKQILDSNRLELEGQHFVDEPLAYPVQVARALDEQYSACGRFVWFTERRNYQSSNTPAMEAQGYSKNEAGIIIDSDLINVKKWHYVKRDNKNNAAFMKVAGENDRAAQRNGDDPYDWWVSPEPIDLTQIRFQTFFMDT